MVLAITTQGTGAKTNTVRIGMLFIRVVIGLKSWVKAQKLWSKFWQQFLTRHQQHDLRYWQSKHWRMRTKHNIILACSTWPLWFIQATLLVDVLALPVLCSGQYRTNDAGWNE